MGDVCGCVVLIRAGVDIFFFWPVSLTVFAGGFSAFFSQYLKTSPCAEETEDWRRERRNDKKGKTL